MTALALVVDALAYWLTGDGHDTFPPTLTVVWFMDRHPCDGVAWIAGIEFEYAT